MISSRPPAPRRVARPPRLTYLTYLTARYLANRMKPQACGSNAR